MAKIESWFDCDLKRPVQVQVLSGNVFSLDNNGSRIGVKFYDNGQKTTVTGSVSGRFILANGQTINAITGTLATVNGQSVAYIDVPQSVLHVPGPLKITIQLTDSSVVTTVAAILATVYQTKTDDEIVPSQQVIDDWNAAITQAIGTQNLAIANQDAKIDDLKSALDQTKDQLTTQDILNLRLTTKNVVDLSNAVLTLGYYNYAGVWQNNSNYAATKYFIKMPNGCAIQCSSTTYHVYVMEFNPATMEKIRQADVAANNGTAMLLNTQAQYMYSLVVYSGTEMLEPPTSGFSFVAFGSNNDLLQNVNVAIISGNILSKGEYHISDNLEYGYFESDYCTWYADKKHLVPMVLYKFPDGCDICMEIDSSYGADAYIKEFTYNGTNYVRTGDFNDGNKTIIHNTKSDKLYSFDFYKSSTWSSVPVTGWDIKVTSPNYNMISDVLFKGEYELNTSLYYGYFQTENAVWATDPSNRHISPKNLFQFPDKSIVTIEINASYGAEAYIKEFTYDGAQYTGVGYHDGAKTSIVASGNKFYAFDFYKSTGWSSLPSSGWKIHVSSAKQGKADSNSIEYSYSASSKELTITSNDTQYVIKREMSASIHLDSWRLYTGKIKIDGAYVNMWNQSDAEGPIKIDNETDFISGYHGDEILDNATIYIDNDALDLTADAYGTCSSVMLYQESTCYRADNTDTEAFTRYKKVRIIGNDFSVQQRWVSKISCTVTRGALCLMQCPKSIIVGWDTDLLLPMQSKDTGAASLSKKTKVGSIYLDDGKSISLIPEVGNDNEYFTPFMQNFTDQQRLKFYFDMYNGKTLQIGDELLSKFTFAVNAL